MPQMYPLVVAVKGLDGTCPTLLPRGLLVGNSTPQQGLTHALAKTLRASRVIHNRHLCVGECICTRLDHT
jgi:hypothetical protein